MQHSSHIRTALRAGLFAAAFGWFTAAGAQPVTHPDPLPCRVSIAYAPDNVRAEIEAWVRAEPRCDKQLEVRVVPTDGGLYLMARDDQGHVRERVVPDAQSAAVLVVSWAADDSIGPTPPLPPAAPEPVASAPPPTDPGFVETRGPSDDSVGLVVSQPRFVKRQLEHRWLTLGGITTIRGGVGARAQIDLIERGHWTLGASGEWLDSGGTRGRDQMEAMGHSGKAALYIARTGTLGPFEIRAQIGAGAELSTSSSIMDGPAAVLAPFVEAGVFANLRLGSDWGLVGGPILDISATKDQPANLTLFLGLQHRL
jgi:hypothetical protein